MMKTIYLFIILLSFLISCREVRPGIKADIMGLKMPREISYDSSVNYTSLDTLLFKPDKRRYETSEILDLVRFIRLETNADCMIGSVGKVQFVDGLYYLLDDYTGRNAIHIFDTQGNHIQSIKNIGRGPGEYKDILDFDVDDRKNIFIVNSTGSVIEYDSLFQYKRTISQEVAIRTISAFNGFLIGISDGSAYRNPQGKILHVISPEGRTVSSFLEYSEGSSNTINRGSALTKSNGKLYVNIPFSPIIYSIDSVLSVKAEYYLVLNYTMSDGKTGNRFFTDPSKDFFFSDQFVYCSITLPVKANNSTNYLYFSGFSKSGQTFFPLSVDGRISDGMLDPLPLMGITDDGIGISVLDVDYLQGNLRLERARIIADSTGVRRRVYSNNYLGSDTLPGSLYDIIKNLDENDNPCIVLVKLKPFGVWDEISSQGAR